MVWGSTQPLTEMSTRNLPGGKGRPAREADNLSAICEPTVWRKCDRLDVSQLCGPSPLVIGIAFFDVLNSSKTVNLITQRFHENNLQRHISDDGFFISSPSVIKYWPF
jgi:hypothetical protein